VPVVLFGWRETILMLSRCPCTVDRGTPNNRSRPAGPASPLTTDQVGKAAVAGPSTRPSGTSPSLNISDDLERELDRLSA
jgi:hypothetical protein